MKRMTLAVLLFAWFVIAAMAAPTMALDQHQPAAVGEYAGLSQTRTDSHQNIVIRCLGVNEYYYYSGSLDYTSSNANGLSNEEDAIVTTGSHIYQPFSVVSKGIRKHLTVTGLCINSFDPAGTGIDNPTPYEVRFGARVGSGGDLVCKGMATSTDRGYTCSTFANCYTHAVNIRRCKLAGSVKRGRQYHMNLTPQCFKNQVCGSARYFEVTDDSNLEHVGPPTNRGAALWNSTFFGENWVNPNTVFGGQEMESFSAGVTGKLVK